MTAREAPGIQHQRNLLGNAMVLDGIFSVWHRYVTLKKA